MPNAIAGRNKAVQATAKRAKRAHLWVVVGEADEAEALDEQWRALVPQGATQHSLALWDAVALDVWSGVAVGVASKAKAGYTTIGRTPLERTEDDTTCAPGKLVPERVVARLGGRQATAVRGKLKYLPHTQRHKTTERVCV